MKFESDKRRKKHKGMNPSMETTLIEPAGAGPVIDLTGGEDES